MTPLARFGTATHIAGAVAFLVGPDASWTTRRNVPVDGGIVSRWTMALPDEVSLHREQGLKHPCFNGPYRPD